MKSLRKQVKLSVLVMVILGMFHGVDAGFLGDKASVLAKINGSKITKTEFDYRLNQYSDDEKKLFDKKENKEKLLDSMINEEIILIQAKKKKLHKDAAYKQKLDILQKELLIQDFIQKEIADVVSVDKKDIEAYYEKNDSRFKKKPQYDISHIIVKTKKKAGALLARIKDGESFYSLAKKENIDASKARGGRLGWLSRDMVVPEFGDAMVDLKKNGALSSVVQSPFGWHVIKRHDRRMRPRIKLKDIEKQIEQEVLTAKRKERLDSIISDAKASLRITRNIENI